MREWCGVYVCISLWLALLGIISDSISLYQVQDLACLPLHQRTNVHSAGPPRICVPHLSPRLPDPHPSRPADALRRRLQPLSTELGVDLPSTLSGPHTLLPPLRSADSLRQRLEPLSAELGVDLPSTVDLVSSQPAIWAINTPALIKDRRVECDQGGEAEEVSVCLWL